MNKTNAKKIVLRKDLASGEMVNKKELVRIVRQPNGEVIVDITKKANGRGAYIKADLDSLNKIKKNRALERVLKVKINDTVYEAIAQEITTNWD